MKIRLRSLILASIAGTLSMLVACGSNASTDTALTSAKSPSAVQFYGAKIAASVADLPTCDSTRTGQLYYVLADSLFQFCATNGYQAIDLSGKTGSTGSAGTNGTNGVDGAPGIAGVNGTNGVDGAPGIAGANGSNGVDGAPGIAGVNGTNGTNGVDGSSCSVVVNTDESRTISCTDGTKSTVENGKSCTVVDNQDGSYNLTCSGTTVIVRNGINGTNGLNGSAGAVGSSGSKGDAGSNGTDGINCTVSDDHQGTLTQTC